MGHASPKISTQSCWRLKGSGKRTFLVSSLLPEMFVGVYMTCSVQGEF